MAPAERRQIRVRCKAMESVGLLTHPTSVDNAIVCPCVAGVKPQITKAKKVLIYNNII